MKQEKKIIDIKLHKVETKEINLKIKGLTPYMPERQSANIADEYDKKKSGQRVDKDTRSEAEKVEEKIHYNEKGEVCIPSSAFYNGMIEMAPYIEGLDKKKVMGSIRMLKNMIPITYKSKSIREDVGRSAGITKAPRKIIRTQFIDWSCEVPIKYNVGLITPELIVNLLDLAGFQDGVGAWRPQKKGTFGQYEIIK